MHNLLSVPVLVIAALFVGVVLLLLISRAFSYRKDYGAHIARRHGRARSPEWSRVAMEHRRHEPACVACGYRGKKVQVHHIRPFHLHPQLELDPTNLITLCEARGREHHLLLGHLDAWDSYNEHIRADAKHFYRKTAKQIREDLHWQKKMALRP